MTTEEPSDDGENTPPDDEESDISIPSTWLKSDSPPETTAEHSEEDAEEGTTEEDIQPYEYNPESTESDSETQQIESDFEDGDSVSEEQSTLDSELGDDYAGEGSEMTEESVWDDDAGGGWDTEEEDAWGSEEEEDDYTWGSGYEDESEGFEDESGFETDDEDDMWGYDENDEGAQSFEEDESWMETYSSEETEDAFGIDRRGLLKYLALGVGALGVGGAGLFGASRFFSNGTERTQPQSQAPPSPPEIEFEATDDMDGGTYIEKYDVSEEVIIGPQNYRNMYIRFVTPGYLAYSISADAEIDVFVLTIEEFSQYLGGRLNTVESSRSRLSVTEEIVEVELEPGEYALVLDNSRQLGTPNNTTESVTANVQVRGFELR